MCINGVGSGVNLVTRMQPSGDLQNVWIMFDHVKRVVGWTIMACHVYDSAYCKVMTIANCDMQFEDTEAQKIMWTKLKTLCKSTTFENRNSRDSWLIMQKPIKMPWELFMDQQNHVWRWLTRTQCLFHWTQLLNKHIKQLIKPKFQDQHIFLCH